MPVSVETREHNGNDPDRVEEVSDVSLLPSQRLMSLI